jgi:hypothetical protein
MARPQKEGLEYFSHDVYTDEKIEAMEAKYGLAGHAFYFKLLERIYRTKDGELDLSDDDTIRTIAKNWHISVLRFNNLLATALKNGLFDQQLFQKTKRLSSNGVKKRIRNVNDKRESMRQKYLETKLNPVISDAETNQKFSRNSAETGESKVNINIKINNKEFSVEIPKEKIKGNTEIAGDGKLLIFHQSLEKCIEIAAERFEVRDSQKTLITAELERLGIDWRGLIGQTV